MAKEIDFKIGDKVKHRFRENKYQYCTIVEVEEGCNGLIKVLCKDGFYGGEEESNFCPQDLTKIN
jgi:hypothetical protein